MQLGIHSESATCVGAKTMLFHTQVQSIAKGHNVQVSQVCLRYVLQRGAILAVGTGSNATTAGDYAKENLDIYGFNLSDSEMTYLDGLSN